MTTEALEHFFDNRNWQSGDDGDWQYEGEIDPQQAAAELAQLKERDTLQVVLIAQLRKELTRCHAEIKLQYDIAENNQKASDHLEEKNIELSQIIKDAIQFVAKWANDHDSEIGRRMVRRMEEIVNQK